MHILSSIGNYLYIFKQILLTGKSYLNIINFNDVKWSRPWENSQWCQLKTIYNYDTYTNKCIM